MSCRSKNKMTFPKDSFCFIITEDHVKRAKKCDPNNCVVAQALIDAGQENLPNAEVLRTVTTLRWIDGRIHRYQTPKVLFNGIDHYDETGVWNLPLGVEYQLPPLKKYQTPAARRKRSQERRAAGDPAMNKKYKPTGNQKPRLLTPRLMNLKAIREQTENIGKK